MGANAVGLPEGFVLDQRASSAPALPDGFVLDQHSQQPQGFMANAADVAKGAATGLVNAVGDIPSTIPLGAKALGDLVDAGLRRFGMMTPEMEQAKQQRESLGQNIQASVPASFNARFSGQNELPQLAAALHIPPPQGEAGQAAQAVSSFLPGAAGMSGGMGRNLAMGAAAGAGAYGGERVAPDNAIAPVIGAVAGGAAGARTLEGLAARQAARAVPSAEAVLENAGNTYRGLREMALQPMQQEHLDNLAEAARAKMAKLGPRPVNAPGAYADIEALRTPGTKGQPDVADLVAARQNLKGYFENPMPDPNKAAARIALPMIEKEIETQSPAVWQQLQNADKDYSAGRTAQRLDKREAKAELRASGEHSGLNYGNKLIQNVHNMLLNDKEARGLTEAERTTLKNISSGPLFNSIRYAGNLMGGGGGLGALTAGAVGAHLAGHDEAFAAPLTGLGLRLLGNRMVAGRAAKASAQIRARAPFSQAQGILGPQPPMSNAEMALLAGLLGRPAVPAAINSSVQQ